MEKKNVLHSIKANLYDNILTDDPNDFMARVSSERTLGISEICYTAVSRGGAASSAEAMEHNVNLFLKEMAYQLCDGFSVNTGYFTAGMQIRGVFKSANESFDPQKHTLLFQFNQGEVLRKELPAIEVRVMGLGDSNFAILQVTDVKSESVNEYLTPGKNLKIKGYKLRIAGDNPDNGIYFINENSGERTQVHVSDIVLNNPSEVIIVIPELVAGNYKIEIITQFSNSSTFLKETRKALFDKTLTVL